MDGDKSPTKTKIQPFNASEKKDKGDIEANKVDATMEAAVTEKNGKIDSNKPPRPRRSFTDNFTNLANKTKNVGKNVDLVGLQNAKKATEKEFRKAKKLFIMYLVRCDRLIILTAVLFSLMSILVEQGINKCIVNHGTISHNDNMTFELTNCNLFITTVEEDIDQWQYQTRSYVNSIVPNDNGFIAASNFLNQYYCKCQIHIQMNTLNHVPNLNVKINDDISTGVMSQVRISGTSGSLNTLNISSIRGNAQVEIKNIRIKSTINIDIMSGSISLIEIDMPENNNNNVDNNKGNMLAVNDGNIFLSVLNNYVKVFHNAPTAGTCFRAKNISKNYYDQTNSNMTEINENINSNNTVVSNKINKLTILCADLKCLSSTYSFINIKVTNGAFFAYLNNNSMFANNNNTGIVDPMSSLTSSTLNTSWLQIDDERSIAEMKHFRKGMPNTDMYALLNLDQSLGSPPHFIFTNKPVYLKLAPWVLSSMSFGVVSPKLFKLKLQILPECGFDGLQIKTANDIGILSKRLEHMLREEASDSIGARLVKKVEENEHLEGSLEDLNIEKGRFNRDIAIVTSTYMIDSNGKYEEQTINSFDDWFLNSAILISMFLAVIFGTATVCISMKVARNIINGHFEKIDRYENFLKLQAEVEKPEYLVPAFKERYTKRMQSEKYESTETERNIFLFTLPEIFLSLWREAQSNSLQAFLQQCSAPATSYGGTKKGKRYKASIVQPIYEEFCKSFYLSSALLYFYFPI